MRTIAVGVLVTVLASAWPCWSQEITRFRFEAADLAGSSVDRVQVGEQFQLRVYINDVRPEPLGILSAFLDVDYDAQRISYVHDSLTFGDQFGDLTSADTSPLGILDEVGSFINGSLDFPPLPNPVGAEEVLFVSARFRAERVGSALLAGNPADNLPRHSITVLGLDDPVAAAQVHYDVIEVKIVPEPGALSITVCAVAMMLFGLNQRTKI